MSGFLCATYSELKNKGNIDTWIIGGTEMSDANELVKAAQKEITKILAKLETDTGRVVVRLQVQEGGFDTITEKGEFRRYVVIELAISPGSGWD